MRHKIEVGVGNHPSLGKSSHGRPGDCPFLIKSGIHQDPLQLKLKRGKETTREARMADGDATGETAAAGEEKTGEHRCRQISDESKIRQGDW